MLRTAPGLNLHPSRCDQRVIDRILVMEETQHHTVRKMRPLPPFHSYPLVAKRTLISASPEKEVHAVRLFTFAYPPDISLSFKHTDHVKVARPGPFKPRSYTPTSESSRTGSFDLVLKIYPGGTSEWLDSRPIGSRIIIFGPLPLPVKPIAYQPAPFIVIIALGIGITKGFVCAREELRRNRFVTLIYSVRYRDEAIFTTEIKELQRDYPEQFELMMIASREHVEGWTYGRVDENFVRDNIQQHPKESTRILVVGTKDMIKSVWKTLGRVGYTKTDHALTRKRLKP